MPRPKKTKQQPTPLQIAHQKFLKKMGVTKKQLQERKSIREEGSDSTFRPDTLQSVRRAYDD